MNEQEIKLFLEKLNLTIDDPPSDQCTSGKCNNIGRHIFNEHWLCTDCFKLALEAYLDRY